ncbi:MAG: SDR family oxidoreductase [Verrucomicrobia bacterium]|nr:SDR family oxidoreductase [Verrucomicrobiota bacterium]
MRKSQFTGRIALITGASAGIGREFAMQLAPALNTIVLVARRGDRLEALESELTSINPKLKLFSCEVDLRNRDQLEAFCDWLDESGLSIDFLINNAGLGDHGPFRESEWQRVSSMLKVNVYALTYLTFRVLPFLRRSKRGAILNVSSIASFLPVPNSAVYASTKAYVTSFSEALRAELRSSNVSVTVLCPGPISTEFLSLATRAGEIQNHMAPEWFVVPVQQVVREALEAVRKDRARVVPGAFVNFTMTIVAFIPMFIKRLVLNERARRDVTNRQSPSTV